VKILVPCKRVPDSDQKIRLLPDGSDIDRANLTYVINPFDAIALEEAIRLRQARNDVEVVAIGIGELEYEKELRMALAMGADRAIFVYCEAPLDPWNVASVLVGIVAREDPRLILMGKQAIDDDANQTGQFLAARLGWPQATFASRVECFDGEARVARETDAGIETIRVKLPAVITADLRLNEPRYASLPSIMKARKKPIETISPSDLDVTIEPRLQVLKMESASAARECVTVPDVDALLRLLREEAKVL
jgi:electron transfer flavoprotein beta subunit